jgi:hypothetical protein
MTNCKFIIKIIIKYLIWIIIKLAKFSFILICN